MSVRIEIDNRAGVFTCLDTITGRVVFNVEKHTQKTVSSITVKLEGISRTRLLVAKENDPDNKKAVTEMHKLLYQVETVFPAPEILSQQLTSGSSGHPGYTLPPGTHIYPFKFRIPVNNACRQIGSRFQKLTIEKGGWEYAKDAEHHTRNTLPPSLFSLPGGADGEIRYFIKVTVNRPQFYRINIRTDEAIVFLPIDPPRPTPTGEIFARKEHLLHFPILQSAIPKKKGFWGFGRKPENVAPDRPFEEPRFTIEARLPSPPILAPKEPLPLRIILVKLAPFSTPVVLKQLQLRLFMTTYITAHGNSEKVFLTVPLFNTLTEYRRGMNIPFTFEHSQTPVGVSLEVDRSIWSGWSLPEHISPSFRTCNITMSYQLEVTCAVGLESHANVDQISLVLPLEIYSGINPPAKLLEAARVQPTNLHQPSVTHPASASGSSHHLRPRPASAPSMTFPSTLQVPQSYEGGLGSNLNSPVSPVSLGRRKSNIWQTTQHAITDAPPTYEDAVLLSEDVDVGVADGPRREYPMQSGYFSRLPEAGLAMDEKGSLPRAFT